MALVRYKGSGRASEAFGGYDDGSSLCRRGEEEDWFGRGGFGGNLRLSSMGFDLSGGEEMAERDCFR